MRIDQDIFCMVCGKLASLFAKDEMWDDEGSLESAKAEIRKKNILERVGCTKETLQVCYVAMHAGRTVEVGLR